MRVRTVPNYAFFSCGSRLNFEGREFSCEIYGATKKQFLHMLDLKNYVLLLVVAFGTVAIPVVLQADVGLDATVHWRADSAEPSFGIQRM